MFFFLCGCKNYNHLHAEREPILHANGRLINIVAGSSRQPYGSWARPVLAQPKPKRKRKGKLVGPSVDPT
jgi:hypothetical protein